MQMAYVDSIHDSDLDPMSDDEDEGKFLCCGGCFDNGNIRQLRGTPTDFCQIITSALTSDKYRDSIDMVQIEELLSDFPFLSSVELKKMCYFSDTRINMVEDYTSNLLVSRQHLKELAMVSIKDSHSGVFETAGDISYEINGYNWMNSTPHRCNKGASGSTIIVAVNETINCMNEVRQIRGKIQSEELQTQLESFLRTNWESFKMCRDSNCSAQKEYRYIIESSKKMVTFNNLEIDLCSLVIDDSPLNSGDFGNCYSDQTRSNVSNNNGKRLRIGGTNLFIPDYYSSFRSCKRFNP